LVDLSLGPDTTAEAANEATNRDQADNVIMEDNGRTLRHEGLHNLSDDALERRRFLRRVPFDAVPLSLQCERLCSSLSPRFASIATL
jgi:hypothetical protein